MNLPLLFLSAALSEPKRRRRSLEFIGFWALILTLNFTVWWWIIIIFLRWLA